MRFFTRQRYEALQEDDDGDAEEEWRRAGGEYARMLDDIRDHLPESARSLSQQTFHDGRLEHVEWPDPRTLRLIVDASGNPWGSRGKFEFLFSGVEATTYREPAPGDWWLYEEVHLAEVGFALHVLLQKSELFVEASSVRLRRMGAER